MKHTIRLLTKTGFWLVPILACAFAGPACLFAEGPSDRSRPKETEASPANEAVPDTETENAPGVKKDSPLAVKSEGSLWFSSTTNALNSDFVTNLPRVKREGDHRAEWRPNYVFGPDGKIQGILKPRISAGLRTESRSDTPTSDVTVARLGLYEGFVRYRPTSVVKIEAGFVDVTGGYGQLFNPGNIWKSENVAGNPTAENASALASVMTFALWKNLTFRVLAGSNYTNENARLASPSDPDNPPSTYTVDTTNVYDAQKARAAAALTEKYDGSRPGGTYYSAKRQDDIYERPLYLGGDMTLTFDRLETKVSARGAGHNAASFGASSGLTLFDSILLYAEGNMTRGRSGLIPVSEGDRQQVLTAARAVDAAYLRFADPLLNPLDRQEGYGYMAAIPGTQYQMLYDNRSDVRRALGGLQYTLSELPITLNAEYAYDGNGYSKSEYQTYRRAIHWAAGPGLGRLGVTSELPLDEGKALYAYNPSSAGTLLGQVTGGQTAAGAAGAGTTGRMPVRLGQHYGLLQMSYQPDGARDMVLLRYVGNLQDRSGYGAIYVSRTINDSWQAFAMVAVFGGPFESEFNSMVRNSVSLGAVYSW